MSSEEQLASDLFHNVLWNKSLLYPCKKWLGNLRLSPHSENLIKEPDVHLSQATFAKYVLNDIRRKASKLLSASGSPIDKTNELPFLPAAITPVDNNRDDHPPATISPMQNKSGTPLLFGNECAGAIPRNSKPINLRLDDYYSQFPELENSCSSAKAPSSKRRINPTPISREIHEGTGDISGQLSSNFTKLSLKKEQEEMYKKRFYTKKDSSSKKGHLDSPNVKDNHKMPIKRKQLSSVLGKRKRETLDRVIVLYNTIINCALVPNISNELKFLLKIFHFAGEHESLCVLDTNESHDFLSSSREWLYFCVHVFVKQDKTMNKTEFIIRQFIYKKVAELYEEILPTNFLEITKVYQPREYHDELISLKLLNGDEPKESNFKCCADFKLFLTGKEKFLNVQTDWKTKCSDDALIKEFDFMHEIIYNATQMYHFANFVIQCLLYSLKENIINKNTSEQKLAQLNSRLTKPYSDYDDAFVKNEKFFKFFIDYCFSHHPGFIQYLKYWLLWSLSILSKNNPDDFGDSMPSDVKHSAIITLKIKISLGKFLGYLEFYQHLKHDIKNEELAKVIPVRSEILPSFDLKQHLLSSCKDGTLTVTVPWIVQFLNMADSVAYFLPYYNDVIFILISIYFSFPQKVFKEEQFQSSMDAKKDYLIKLSIMLPTRNFLNDSDLNIKMEGMNTLIREEAFLFLKLWIGKLFDSRNIKEVEFFNLLRKYCNFLQAVKFKGGVHASKSCIDTSVMIDDEAFLLVCSHFSKMKYWESANTNSSYVKNIRPVFLEIQSEEGEVDKPVDIQMLLEEQFLSDHKTLSNLISFIVNRVFAVFQKIVEDAKSEIMLGFIPKSKRQEALQERIIAAKADVKKRIDCSVKSLISPDHSDSVITTCINICTNRINKLISDWLTTLDIEEDEELEIFTEEDIHDELSELSRGSINDEEEEQEEEASIESDTSINVLKMCDSLSEVVEAVNNINAQMRDLISGEGANVDVNYIANEFESISRKTSITVMAQEKQILHDMYNLSWHYVLHLVTTQPHLVTDVFLVAMSDFWFQNRFLGTTHQRIFCPQFVRASSLKDRNVRRKSCQVLAKLIKITLERNLMRMQTFEYQCISLLQHTWEKEELDFLKICFIEIIGELRRSALIEDKLIEIVECVSESIIEMNIIEY